MLNPKKIILFAIFVAVFVSYFGDKLVMLSNRAAEQQKQTQNKTDDRSYYGEVNSGNYGGEIYISQSRDGQYWITIDVNGTPTRFMVDTGASHISLSYKDAKAAGLDPDGLNYNKLFSTANGVSRKAMVNIDAMSLESIQILNIPATVSLKGQMRVSLLGMNFLNRISGFNMKNGQMILIP